MEMRLRGAFTQVEFGAAGDGGAVTTNDQRLALCCLRNYGSVEKNRHDSFGVNRAGSVVPPFYG